MTDKEHEQKHYLGAYVLNQLSTEERAWVDGHLAGCAECTSELRSIEPVAKMLPLVDAANVRRPRVHSVSPSMKMTSNLFAQIAHERRSARQRRVYGSVAASLVAAAAVVLALMVPSFRSDDTHNVQFAAAPQGVVASARMADESWGTKIHLEVSGLEGRQTVWLEKPDGSRASAGSFNIENGGKVTVDLSTDFKTKDAVALCVSAPNAAPVLRAPLV